MFDAVASASENVDVNQSLSKPDQTRLIHPDMDEGVMTPTELG